MLKLLDASLRTKEILSANKNRNISIPNLIDGINFNYEITRESF